MILGRGLFVEATTFTPRALVLLHPLQAATRRRSRKRCRRGLSSQQRRVTYISRNFAAVGSVRPSVSSHARKDHTRHCSPSCLYRTHAWVVDSYSPSQSPKHRCSPSCLHRTHVWVIDSYSPTRNLGVNDTYPPVRAFRFPLSSRSFPRSAPCFFYASTVR